MILVSSGFVLTAHPYYDEPISMDAETDILAQTLSTYGPKGVQMALRFRLADVTLPRRVMDILCLKKEWLEAEEAKEVLFGETCEYDAVERKWERIEEAREKARRALLEAAEREMDDSE